MPWWRNLEREQIILYQKMFWFPKEVDPFLKKAFIAVTELCFIPFFVASIKSKDSFSSFGNLQINYGGKKVA